MFNFSINRPSLQFSCLCTCPMNYYALHILRFQFCCQWTPSDICLLFQSCLGRRRCCPGVGGRSAHGWASADWLRPTRGGVHKPVVDHNVPMCTSPVDQPVHNAPIGHDQGPPLQTPAQTLMDRMDHRCAHSQPRRITVHNALMGHDIRLQHSCAQLIWITTP